MVDRVERAVVTGCKWSRRGGRGLQVVASRVAGDGVAMVADCCSSFKVRDGWCEIKVGKGLGFCFFFIGLLQNEVCFFNWE